MATKPTNVCSASTKAPAPSPPKNAPPYPPITVPTSVRYLVNFGNITTQRASISLSPIPTMSDILEDALKQLVGIGDVQLEYAGISTSSDEAVTPDNEGLLAFLSFYSEKEFNETLIRMLKEGKEVTRVTARLKVDTDKVNNVVKNRDERKGRAKYRMERDMMASVAKRVLGGM